VVVIVLVLASADGANKSSTTTRTTTMSGWRWNSCSCSWSSSSSRLLIGPTNRARRRGRQRLAERRGNLLLVLVVVGLLMGPQIEHDERGRPRLREENPDEGTHVPKRSIKRLNIATTRASICLPGETRSTETNPLATAASRQAAHSKAEPRASSKNLARWRPCRLPFPSAVLRRTERLARSSC
jgi:hypothetical protein